MECGLCYEAFKMTDEVFNCRNNHVFHTRCYDDRAMDTEGNNEEIEAMINKCPTCGALMNITVDQTASSSQQTGYVKDRYSLNKS